MINIITSTFCCLVNVIESDLNQRCQCKDNSLAPLSKVNCICKNPQLLHLSKMFDFYLFYVWPRQWGSSFDVRNVSVL